MPAPTSMTMTYTVTPMSNLTTTMTMTRLTEKSNGYHQRAKGQKVNAQHPYHQPIPQRKRLQPSAQEPQELTVPVLGQAPAPATILPVAAAVNNEALAMAKQLALNASESLLDDIPRLGQAIGPSPRARAMPMKASPLSQTLSQSRIPPPQIPPPQIPPTQIPPPQRHQPHASLPFDLNVHPNGVVPVPGRILPSSTNTPQIPPSKVLKSSWTSTKPARNQPPTLPSNDTAVIRAFPADERGICLICKTKHAFNGSCVNFHSQISLRLAIDSLRDHADHRAYRDMCINQLRQLTGP